MTQSLKQLKRYLNINDMKEKTTKCPCKNCICIPICREKDYIKMIRNCSLLKNLLYGNKFRNFWRILIETEKILKPVRWYIEIKDNGVTELITHPASRE